MPIRFYLGLVSITLLLLSCNREFDGYLIEKFPASVKLEGTSILESEVGGLYLSLVDTFLVYVANRDTFFHVYDRKKNPVVSFGPKGRGPGEFMIPPIIRDAIVEKNSTKILVDDQLKKTLVTIDLTSSIDKGKIVESVIKLPRRLLGIKSVFFSGNNEFIGIYDDRDHKVLDEKTGVFYYNPKLDSIKTFKLFNLEIEPYEILPEMNLNARLASISPDRSKIATVVKRYPIMEIFKVGSMEPVRFELEPNLPSKNFNLKDYKNGELTIYYQYMDVTNSNIYLLFSGHKENEPQKDQKILVVDWEGNPQSQFLIPDNYDLSTFNVDEKNKKIYGSSYSNDSIYIFNYDNQ